MHVNKPPTVLALTYFCFTQVVHRVKTTLIDLRPFCLTRQQHLAAISRDRSRCQLQQLQPDEDHQQQHSFEDDSLFELAQGLSSFASAETEAGAAETGRACDERKAHAAVHPSPPSATTPLLCFRQAQLLFNQSLWGCAATTAEHATGADGAHEGGQERHEKEMSEEVVSSEACVRHLSREEAVHALRHCSLVVGLHPDQATEEILQFVCASKKACVIVPCCVFPRLFPHRRLLSPVSPDATESVTAADSCSTDSTSAGTHVLTYSALIQYCQQQLGHGARTVCLPFEGANQLVYSL